jgi:HD superfamily phosphohydrolase
MKFIKDPVHGFVEVPNEITPLLDSLPLQRLRHIRQLGFAYLVYPGANHSRFEHSLGTMHLANRMCRNLGLDEEESRMVTSAALLHDCGHGPFSHATESFMKEYIGRSHEQIGHLIQGEPLEKVLEAVAIDPTEIIGILEGDHPLSTILHGDLDVDRMDYLLRDAHYTGVPYGTVDAQRLIQSTRMGGEGLILEESGTNAAESLLIARTLMRPAVYIHHVSRIATAMLQRALMEQCAGMPRSYVEGLMGMDDATLMLELLRSDQDTPRRMAKRLYARILFKRAVYAGLDQLNVAALQREAATLRGGREIARAIAETAGVEDWQVLVDIPPLPSDFSMEVMVQNRTAILHLSDISPLVPTLNDTRRAQWRVGVFSPPEVRKEVEAAALELLHVRKATKQDRLPDS